MTSAGLIIAQNAIESSSGKSQKATVRSKEGHTGDNATRGPTDSSVERSGESIFPVNANALVGPPKDDAAVRKRKLIELLHSIAFSIEENRETFERELIQKYRLLRQKAKTTHRCGHPGNCS